MRKFQGVKCPKCGKKGLSYASHPHAQGWKDFDRVACRYCNARFYADKLEAHLTPLAPDVKPRTAQEEVDLLGEQLAANYAKLQKALRG